MAGGGKKDKKKKNSKKGKTSEVPLKSPSRRIKKPTRYESEDELERQLLQEAIDISKKEVHGKSSRSTRRSLDPAEIVEHTPEKATRRGSSRPTETPSSVGSKASSKAKTSAQSTPKRRGTKRSRVKRESEEEREEEAEEEEDGEDEEQEEFSSEHDENEDEASAESEAEEAHDGTKEPKAKRVKRSPSFEDSTLQTAQQGEDGARAAHTTDTTDTTDTTGTTQTEETTDKAGPSLEEMAEFVKRFAPAVQQQPQQQAEEVPELDTETLRQLQLQLQQNATALLDLQKKLFQKGSADYPAADDLQIVQTLHQSLATAVALSRIPMSYLISKKGIKKAKKDLGMEKKKETTKTRFSARSMSGQVKSEYAVWSMR